jgi:hypothetical protein
MPFEDLIRSGNEPGLLLADWPAWHHCRDMRARSNGTCATTIASQLVSGIPDFLAEATHLCDQLARRLA